MGLITRNEGFRSPRDPKPALLMHPMDRPTRPHGRLPLGHVLPTDRTRDIHAHLIGWKPQPWRIKQRALVHARYILPPLLPDPGIVGVQEERQGPDGVLQVQGQVQGQLLRCVEGGQDIVAQRELTHILPLWGFIQNVWPPTVRAWSSTNTITQALMLHILSSGSIAVQIRTQGTGFSSPHATAGRAESSVAGSLDRSSTQNLLGALYPRRF